MAIYHLRAKIVSRGSGHSAVAKAAYRAGEKLRDERTDELKDYSRRKGVAFAGMYAPANAPDWTRDRAAFWNAVEGAEKRKDAQLAREIEISLPHELTAEQRRYLVQDFIRDNFTRKGFVVDCALHEPDRKGDEKNYHAHLLVSLRTVDENGFSKTKDRSQNQKDTLERWRESWERHTNRHLERGGHEERVSCKSLEAQGIEREPVKTLGETATHLERRGIPTERGDENRAIQSRNAEREALKRETQVIDLELEREKRREQETPAPSPQGHEKIRDLAQQWEETKEQTRLSSRFKATATPAPEIERERTPEPERHSSTAPEIDGRGERSLEKAESVAERAVDALDRGITDAVLAVGEVFDRAMTDLFCPDTPEERRQRQAEQRREAAHARERAEERQQVAILLEVLLRSSAI